MKKNKIIVFRFGSMLPVNNELNMAKEVANNEPGFDAAGAPTQFGLFSLFITEMTVKEVAQLFKKTAEEKNDWLPVICIDAETKEACLSIRDEFKNVFEMLTKFEATGACIGVEDICNLSLDQLLDKVRDLGRDQLTQAELDRLDQFSRGEQ